MSESAPLEDLMSVAAIVADFADTYPDHAITFGIAGGELTVYEVHPDRSRIPECSALVEIDGVETYVWTVLGNVTMCVVIDDVHGGDFHAMQ